jgi:hypothetical protein
MDGKEAGMDREFIRKWIRDASGDFEMAHAAIVVGDLLAVADGSYTSRKPEKIIDDAREWLFFTRNADRFAMPRMLVKQLLKEIGDSENET